MKIIPKAELKDGQWYAGQCRNARYAVWDKRGYFIYLRCKFGNWFSEEIKHPEDDTRFDVFEPYMELDFETVIQKPERIDRDGEQGTPSVRHVGPGDRKNTMPFGSVF